MACLNSLGSFCCWRGFYPEREENEPIVEIQSAQTSLRVARAASAQYENTSALSQEEAAKRVQSFCRGFLARARVKKQKRVLSRRLFRKAVQMVDNQQYLNAPRATHGKTPVYITKELVFKETGSPLDEIRLSLINQAYGLCSQGRYNTLVVPEAIVYKELLIERRLPIHSTGFFDQVELYVQNKERFALAARQLTQFLMKVSLPWIIKEKIFPIVNVARYDNLALFLENGEGRVGLIDTERLGTEKEEHTTLNACLAAVTFFPYHVEEIVSAAREFALSDIDPIRTLVLERSYQVLGYWENAYEQHMQFLRQKGIGVHSYKKNLIPKAESAKKLINKIYQVFSKYREFACNEKPEQNTINEQKKFLAEIVEKLRENANTKVEEIAHEVMWLKQPLTTEASLLEKRTVRVKYRRDDAILNRWEIGSFADCMPSHLEHKISQMQIEERNRFIINRIYYEVLTVLQHKKHIANFQMSEKYILFRF